MNKKIISIFFILILITISGYTTLGTNNIKLKKINVSNTTQINNNVPTWNVGDYWKYEIEDLIIESDDMGLNINIEINDFIVEVLEDTGNSYKLQFSATIKGEGIITYSIGYDDPIELSIEFGRLLKTKIKGEVIRNKTNLGLEEIKIEFSGILKIKITDHPLINYPIPGIRIPFKLILETEFTNPYSIIEFPIDIENNWSTTTTTISMKSGIFKCPLLRPINFINNLMSIFNLIPPDYEDISELISDLLPIIDIKNTLELFGINTSYEIQGSSMPIFYCQEFTEINTIAGTYESYKISIMIDIFGNSIEFGNFYYSPDVGRIIKFTLYSDLISELLTLNYGIPVQISNVNFELKETNLS